MRAWVQGHGQLLVDALEVAVIVLVVLHVLSR